MICSHHHHLFPPRLTGCRTGARFFEVELNTGSSESVSESSFLLAGTTFNFLTGGSELDSEEPSDLASVSFTWLVFMGRMGSSSSSGSVTDSSPGLSVGFVTEPFSFVTLIDRLR